ncbi:MAG: class IV adenylate cyclase [Wenzhouxiangella sp.]|jgi:adenylate cyclase class IV|nr:class IV adenylate cyclase [Wenzhouxiangella sp.]
MPRNIEIKARVADRAALEQRAATLADEGPVQIFQDDTFFVCPEGRLKLRDFGDGRGELIFYRRADATGPKTSFYRIAPTAEPAALRETLGLALGERGRVIKHRTLYLAGRTRIHLDRVEGLGEFMELEVVLADGEDEATGQKEADELMEQLGIATDQLVEGAYLDLLAKLKSR